MKTENSETNHSSNQKNIDELVPLKVAMNVKAHFSVEFNNVSDQIHYRSVWTNYATCRAINQDSLR